MSNKEYRLKVYSLRTPKFNHQVDIEKEKGKKNNFVKSHFEFQVVDIFFRILQACEGNITKDVTLPNIVDECAITFVDYIDYNNDFSIVILESDLYGNPNYIKNMKKKTIEGQLTREQSVPHKVHLFIEKKHGLLYVSKDRNSIINKVTLNAFFNHYRFILEEYIREWNNFNEIIKMFKMPVIKVDSLPNMDFFSEIENLQRINEFSYSYDPTGSDDYIDFNDDDIMYEEGFRKRVFKEKRTFVDLFNKVDINKLKKLYERIYSKSNYDDFRVVGTNLKGKDVTIKPNLTTRSLVLYLREQSFTNYNDIISEISRELKIDNPLEAKVYDIKNANYIKYCISDELINSINESLKELNDKAESEADEANNKWNFSFN